MNTVRMLSERYRRHEPFDGEVETWWNGDTYPARVISDGHEIVLDARIFDRHYHFDTRQDYDNISQIDFDRLCHFLARIYELDVVEDLIKLLAPESQKIILLTDNDAYNGSLYLFYDETLWKNLPVFYEDDDGHVFRDDVHFPYNAEMEQFLRSNDIEIIRIPPTANGLANPIQHEQDLRFTDNMYPNLPTVGTPRMPSPTWPRLPSPQRTMPSPQLTMPSPQLTMPSPQLTISRIPSPQRTIPRIPSPPRTIPRTIQTVPQIPNQTIPLLPPQYRK